MAQQLIQSIPFPPEIRAQDKASFANYTFLHRVPHIIQQVIDDHQFEPKIKAALENLLADVLTQTILPLTEMGSESALIWQHCVTPYLGRTWFEVPFFFAEMYLYRRILEAVGYFTLSDTQGIDPFFHQKQKGLASAIAQTHSIEQLCDRTAPPRSFPLENLKALLLANLWSNRADLSQLSGLFNPTTTCVEVEDSKFLLINDLTSVVNYVSKFAPQMRRIDLILDNVGMELIADLALAEYFLRSDCANQVFLHCKQDPVFVSDATVKDVDLTIKALQAADSTLLNDWAQRLSTLIQVKQLVICDHAFWTLPFYFREMPESLQQDFSKSDLIISKGDANYRRLVDDRHWDFTTPIVDVVNYLPAPCLALRVLKCEVLVGINAEKLNTLNQEDNWMINGDYALIQFVTSTSKRFRTCNTA